VHRLFVDNNVDIVAEIHWIGETPMRHDVERLATSLGARLRCWAALPELLAGIDAQAIGALVLEVDRGPDVGAFEALRAASLDLPVIVLSRRPTVHACRLAFKAGAIEFLALPVAQGALAGALRAGLGAHVRRREQGRAARQCRERFASLSEREREVLDMLVEGLTNREIAVALAISTRTVEKHRANLFDKLGSPSLVPLVRRYAAFLPDF
jgi:FixJ family two-component response regulator